MRAYIARNVRGIHPIFQPYASHPDGSPVLKDDYRWWLHFHEFVLFRRWGVIFRHDDGWPR